MAAWMALLSMLLLVVAPVISQLPMAGSGEHHVHVHAQDEAHHAQHPLIVVESHSGSHASHDPLAHALEACGYCFLLTHSPALAAAVGAILTTQFVAGLSVDLRAISQAPRFEAYVPHRPRGPPSLSQSANT